MDKNRAKKEVERLYKDIYGVEPKIITLSADGSSRKYYRLKGASHDEVVGTYNSDLSENRSFIDLAKYFHAAGIRVPEIFGESEDKLCYLQEDLGNVSLFSLLQTEKRMPLSKLALESLVDMQVSDEKEWRDKVFNPEFSEQQMKWDLNYFKYCFVKPSGIIFDEEKLEKDFDELTRRLCHADNSVKGFMYRDFQSRNIMIKDDLPYFIDFQGGRKGLLLYDAVSFLWQAKAGFSYEEKEELLDAYSKKLYEKRKVEKQVLLSLLDETVLLRTLQVLGAYGFRGLIQKKSQFISSIPGALRNLQEMIDDGKMKAYPELIKISRQLFNNPRFHSQSHDGLRLTVNSFSYKNGYPEDFTGNGGGFVFDCRSLPNPGRYEEYKKFTGMDKCVQDFFIQHEEIEKFLSPVVDIIENSLKEYQKRGFTDLQVSFGCTGGQHRSVYCAERLAAMIAQKELGISIMINHREQEVEKILS